MVSVAREWLGGRESTEPAMPTDADKAMLKMVQEHITSASKTSLDYGVQIELANQISNINRIVKHNRYDLLSYSNAAVLALKSESHNIVFAQHTRWKIDAALGTPIHFLPSRLLRHNGPSANVMLGLLCSFGISIPLMLLWIGAVTQFVHWSDMNLFAPLEYYLNNMADPQQNLPILMIILVVASGVSGSCISIMSRITEFSSSVTVEPLVLFLTGLLKPIIGLGSALFLYAVLNAGFISMLIPTLQIPSSNFAAWAAIGFVAGFSERLVPDVVHQLENVLGSQGQTAQNTTTK